MNVNRVEGNLTIIPFDYLIGTRAAVEHVQEEHVLALYTIDEMLEFFRRANLKVRHDPDIGIRLPRWDRTASVHSASTAMALSHSKRPSPSGSSLPRSDLQTAWQYWRARMAAELDRLTGV